MKAMGTEVKRQKDLEQLTGIPKAEKPDSFFRSAMRRLFQHKLAIVGMIIVAFFLLLALLANQLSTHSIVKQNLRNRYAPPTLEMIASTGVVIGDRISVTVSSNGQLFANDAMINVPKWFKNLEQKVQMAPILSAGTVFVITDSGQLVAFEIKKGTELWRTDVGKAAAAWGVGGNLLVLTGDKNLQYLDPAGNTFWKADVGEKVLAKTFGELITPMVLAESGKLYAFDENGSKSVIAKLGKPEMAYFNGDTMAMWENGTIYSYKVGEESRTSVASLEGRIDPLAMVVFKNTVVLSFPDKYAAAFDLDGRKLWQATLESDVISMAYDGMRSLHAIGKDGKLLVINPSSGGITSSRMVQGFSQVHILGTDELGRDVFARILAGGRVSLTLGFIVSVLSVLIGSIIGAVAGYFGGWIDHLIMRIVDFMLAIPSLPLLMIISYILGPSFTTMVFVLVLFGWLGICRVVRSQTLSLKQLDFIEASKALGVSTPRIIFRHVLPNALGPIIVAATLSVGRAILSESQLSYLGLGIQPPTPSWGNMLMQARSYLTTAPWLALWPGLCIFLVLLGFNFIGDGLRDAFDPKLKGNK